MEPFELSLNQVNTNEQELGQSTEYESLYSFSNLVSYDSDFKDHEGTHAVPVLAKKVHDTFNLRRVHGKKSNSTLSISELIQTEAAEHYKQSLTFPNKTTDSANHRSEDSQYDKTLKVFRDRKGQYAPESHHKPAHRQQLKVSPQDLVVNASINHKPSRKSSTEQDTFQAFTETVEALALQQSVIGDSSRAPASAEEIAAALEATRQLMLQSTPKSELKKDTLDTSLDSPSIHYENGSKSLIKDDNENIQLVPLGLDQSIPAPENGEDDDLEERVSIDDLLEAQTKDSSYGSINQSNGRIPMANQSEHRDEDLNQSGICSDPNQSELELIPMPPELITKVFEKQNSSWFSNNKPPTRQLQVIERRTSPSSKPGKKREKKDPPSESTPQADRSLSSTSLSDSPASRDLTDEGQTSSFNSTLATDDADGSFDSSGFQADISDKEASLKNVYEPDVNHNEAVFEEPTKSPSHKAEIINDASTVVDHKALEGDDKAITKNEPTHVDVKKTVSESTTKPVSISESLLAKKENNAPVNYFSFGRNLSIEALSQKCEKLLKEKARLEGQVEVLEAESKAALQQRAQLQSQVAALTQSLKSLEANSRNMSHERDAVAADYETLRQNRGRLEQVIVSAQKLIEDKDLEIKTVNEDLKIAKEEIEAGQEKQRELREELLSRDNAISDLKNKVTELYVEFQTTNQNKILAEGEITSLKSELRTVTTGKEWYSDQLEKAQQGRTHLQGEISQLKRDMIGQATLVERLKADNVRLQQKLTATEQRALEDKEKLARHLEAIEADMLEREAAFAQIKRDRENVETLLKSRMDQDQEVHPDLEEELEKAKREASRYMNQVSLAEQEKTDLAKRLALAQEGILDRDRMVDNLQQRVIESEKSLEEAKLATSDKSAEMDKLKEDLLASQVELNSTKEEKKSFDLALRSLKTDMGKVESSFRQMKADLASKDAEVKSLKEDREKLRGEVIRSAQVHVPEVIQAKVAEKLQASSDEDKDMLRKNALMIEELQFAKDSLDEERTKLREQIKNLEEEVQNLKSQNTSSESNLEVVRTQLIEIESKYGRLVDDKAGLEAELLKAALKQDGSERESLQLKEALQSTELALEKQREIHQDELKRLSSHLQISSQQLQQSNTSHDQSVQQLSSQLRDAQDQLQAASTKHEREMESAQQELQSVESARSTAMDTAEKLREKLLLTQQNLEHEKADYERKLSELMLEMQAVEERSNKPQLEKDVQELTIQLQQARHTLQQERAAQALKLQEMSSAMQENENNRRSLEGEILSCQKEINELKMRLLQTQQEASRETELLRTQLETAAKVSTDQLEAEIKHLQGKLAEMFEDKSSLAKKLEDEMLSRDQVKNEHAAQVKALENEIDGLKADTADIGKLMDEREEMMLMLEKERGRWAGLQQSYESLKEHNVQVESALAHRESSVVELSSHADEELQRKNRQLDELRERMSEAEAGLEEEKKESALMKQKLTEEKEAHTQTRRQTDSLTHAMSELEVDLAETRQQLQSIGMELEKTKDRESQLKDDLQKASSDSVHLRQEKDKLMADVEDHSAKDSLFEQQLKTLEWQVAEKDNEIRALREQVSIAETRQEMENTNMKKSLQATSTDLNTTRGQVEDLKKENKSLLKKVMKLREALTSSVEHAARLHQETNQKVPPPLDMSSIESLLKDNDTSTEQSKPLTVLQQMLGSLRGEISSLQSQVEQHSSAAHSSSQAWKELEAQVLDLQKVCKSSAADREASQSLLADSMRLTQQADQPWQQGAVNDA